jgi:hypothetical protein
MKRISLFVLITHSLLFLGMVLWRSEKIQVRTPIRVRTTVAPPTKTETVFKASHTPTPVKTQATAKPKKPSPLPQKTKPQVSENLLKELRQSIEKIDHLASYRPSIHTKNIPTLQIDQGDKQSETCNFTSHLIQCLQNALELPEKGSVKLELTLNSSGKFLQMRILSGPSERNKKYLEETLAQVQYPAFTESMKEKEHTFVITFSSH